jgi:vesicle-associated membrane protein 7
LTVAKRILERLPAGGDTRTTYAQDRHAFHVLQANGLTFLCMASEDAGRRLPFAYLDDVKGRFQASYGGAAATALAYAFNDEFARVLAQQMDYFNSNPQADTLNRVRGEIAEVKNIMVENIEKVLDRGDKIELLIDKTDSLQGEAFRFKVKSRRLKRAMCIRNAKLAAIVALVCILVLYFILAMACGGLALKGCK